MVFRRRSHRGAVTVELSDDSTCTLEEIPNADVVVTVNDKAGALLYSEGFSFVTEGSVCFYKQFYPASGPVFRFCR